MLLNVIEITLHRLDFLILLTYVHCFIPKLFQFRGSHRKSIKLGAIFKTDLFTKPASQLTMFPASLATGDTMSNEMWTKRWRLLEGWAHKNFLKKLSTPTFSPGQPQKADIDDIEPHELQFLNECVEYSLFLIRLNEQAVVNFNNVKLLRFSIVCCYYSYYSPNPALFKAEVVVKGP